MDDLTRHTILAAAEELFNREQLFKLASSVDEARSRKGLRFWQETLLAELAQRCGIDVNLKANFIAAFAGTKARYAPPKPDDSPAGFVHQMQATWADPGERERWIQSAARDLSKLGSLESYVRCYRALAKFLTADQVTLLYVSLRDISMRSESEWRSEFLKYFKNKIKEPDLPEALDDDHWLRQADDPRSLPINPHTGLPWNHRK